MAKRTPRSLSEAIDEGARDAGCSARPEALLSVEKAVDDYLRQKLTVVSLRHKSHEAKSVIQDFMKLVLRKRTKTSSRKPSGQT